MFDIEVYKMVAQKFKASNWIDFNRKTP